MTKKRKQAPAKAKTAKGAPGDYDVGYGKPPVHSRWGPGQSGYPGGRKKGQRNYKTLLLEVFEAEIEITENGRKSTCTMAKALLLTLVQSGLKDRNIRALTRALELYERASSRTEEENNENGALPEHDLDIISRALGADPDQARGDDLYADKEDPELEGDEPTDDAGERRPEGHEADDDPEGDEEEAEVDLDEGDVDEGAG